MRKIDETRGGGASTLWRLICSRLVNIFKRANHQPAITMDSLALDCIRNLTGTRHKKLDKRLKDIDPKGIYGEHQFKAMRDIRLRKALLLLRSIYEYVEESSDRMSMTRIQCLVPAIVKYFQMGACSIKEYEAENRSMFYFPGIGVRVFITDGINMVEAEVVPDSLVGLNVDSGQALIVLHGKYEGSVATPGNLGKLYRTLFPEDKRKYSMSRCYFWNSKEGLPSSHSAAAANSADKCRTVADACLARHSGESRLLSHVEKTAKPLKFIHRNGPPSWQKQLPFADVLSKIYAQYVAIDEEIAHHPELVQMPEVQTAPPLDLTLEGPMPKCYEEFESEYRSCQRFLAARWAELQEFTGLCHRLESLKAQVNQVLGQLEESSLSRADLDKLYQMALRWENIYACIPTVSADMDDRQNVMRMIDNILRPLAGDNAVIFNKMEKDNGKA